jgi:uncharacterized DUF497 family protein
MRTVQRQVQSGLNDRFIWEANIKKHGISFNEAATVFEDDMSIDLSDIPEITDFSKGRKNPHAKNIKDGYTIIVEHKDYDEVITITKAKKPKGEGGTVKTA